MLGEKIDIINCEDVIISGLKPVVLSKYKRMDEMGVQPKKGPFQPRMPDRFVRKVIKRMLPIRRTRGREAFERIMCHIGTPEKFKDQQLQDIENAKAERLSTLKFVKVGEICKELGSKMYTNNRT
jgi:large subunit ribosomal protein L13